MVCEIFVWVILQLVVYSRFQYYCVAEPHAPFPPRIGHATVTCNDNLYLFGGWNPDSGTYYRDLWVYDAAVGQWRNLITSGDRPSKRQGSSLTLVNSQFLLLFGGDNGQEYFNDVFLYSIEESAWMRGVPMSRFRISRRSGHASAIADDGLIHIIGGISQEGQLLDDHWTIDLTSSSPFAIGQDFSVIFDEISTGNAETGDEVSDNPLQNRIKGLCGASLLSIGPRLYLIGGYSTGIGVIKLKDVSQFDIKTNLWSTISSSQVPGAPSGLLEQREGSAVARFGTNILVSGGCEGNTTASVQQCFNDFWLYDPAAGTWQDVTLLISPDKQSGRSGHRIDLLNNPQSIIITGGTSPIEGTQRIVSDQVVMQLHFPQQLVTSTFSKKFSTCSKTVCHCSPGFNGGDCATSELFPNPKRDAECSGHGRVNFDGRCSCYLGFSGHLCETGKNTCLNNCSGHGRCNHKSQCVCDKGFFDLDCSTAANCPSNCCSFGRCDAVTRGCVCDRGHFGIGCQILETQVSEARSKLLSLRDEIQQTIRELSNENKPEHVSLNSNRPNSKAQQTASSELLKLDIEALKALLASHFDFLGNERNPGSSEAINAKIVDKYFHDDPTKTCEAVANIPDISTLMRQSTEPTMSMAPLAGSAGHAGPVLSGETSVAQNRVRSKRLQREGSVRHLGPPGPHGESVDKLYEAEEEAERIGSRSTANGPALPQQLPEAVQAGVPKQFHSTGALLVSCVLLLAAGIGSVVAIFEINKTRRGTHSGHSSTREGHRPNAFNWISLLEP